MNFKKHTNYFISWNHACFITTFQSLSYFVMSIIVLKVSINFKDILNSYNKISLILNYIFLKDLSSKNDICNEDNVGHLPI